ncbi:MAG TPA: diguanylate cyclase [Candidatus Acidoferrales bacterium]|nr:diguanylate cyclase [Candidatus Acidoferrales bacterium]
MKILIADDDAVMRALLEHSLRGWGYEVVSACDGEEAWNILKEPDSPRIVLLDWMMPGVTGPELCRRVRRRVAPNYRYILLISAREDRSDIICGFESGADDYVTKPIHPDELQARLRVGLRIIGLEDNLLAAREILRHKATHDELTGLLNRAAVDDLLKREMARANREKLPLAVILADIDHFKSVNDTYGHAVGDSVIRELASRMKATVRTYDAVGRYGGEEFLMILPGCDSVGLRQRAVEMLDAIRSHPVETASGNLKITGSIGGAVNTDAPGVTPDGLIRNADVALYQAKHAGRDRAIVFDPAEGNASVNDLLVLPRER